MKMVDTQVLQRVVRTCNDGWLQGWHERNGGNLTYRLSAAEVDQCKPFFDEEPGEWVPLGVRAENLACEYFVATGSGKYMRNVILAPQNCLCLIELNEAGDAWRLVWGLENGGVPTSELPSHLLNHSVRKQATDGKNRVIYHVQIIPLDDVEIAVGINQQDVVQAAGFTAQGDALADGQSHIALGIIVSVDGKHGVISLCHGGDGAGIAVEDAGHPRAKLAGVFHIHLRHIVIRLVTAILGDIHFQRSVVKTGFRILGRVGLATG